MGESPMNVVMLLGADEGQRNGRDLPGAFLALPDRRFITVLVSRMGFFTDASTCWMLIVFRFVLGFGMGVLVPGAVVVLRPARHAAAHLMS
jgi:hypothetical protein